MYPPRNFGLTETQTIVQKLQVIYFYAVSGQKTKACELIYTISLILMRF